MNSNAPIPRPRIGIIGAGGMLPYHLKGFQQAGATVLAVADHRPQAAIEAAARHGIPTVAASVDALLAMPELDAVSIIVPNKFHAPLALEALRAGKHVFCEKPPAIRACEVREMMLEAQDRNLHLLFNFNNRARPLCRAIKARILSGEMGRINSAQAKWVRRNGIPGFGGWFTQKALSGGGPLIDLLHMLDLALHFMGYPEPTHVMARTFDDFIQDKNFKGPWGIPDVEGARNDVESAAHGMVFFQTGQVLSFQTSWAEMVEREEVSVTFQGSIAGARVRRLFEQDGIDASATDDACLFRMKGSDKDDLTLDSPTDPEMGRTLSAANFAEVLSGQSAPLNQPSEAYTLMRIIEAAYASASSGAPVSL
jgi:predicted dehydrogenase